MRSRVPPDIVGLIQNLYHNSFTSVRLPEGLTPLIPHQRGLKQGCPLSPILFNFCPLLRALDSLKEVASVRVGDEKINNLAFADDIKVFSETIQARETSTAK